MGVLALLLRLCCLLLFLFSPSHQRTIAPRVPSPMGRPSNPLEPPPPPKE